MAYTGIGFLSFLLGKEESTPFYILQSILIFMLQLFLFSVLMIKTEAFEYLFFYLFRNIGFYAYNFPYSSLKGILQE